jgi:hypothetical protein
VPHCIEKTGGLLHCQTLTPKLLWRHRPTGEKISGTQHSHSHPWDKPAKPPGQTDFHPTKKKQKKKELNNKNELKRIMQQKGQGALSAPEKGGKANS